MEAAQRKITTVELNRGKEGLRCFIVRSSQRNETKLKTPVVLFELIGKVLKVQQFLFVMLLLSEKSLDF